MEYIRVAMDRTIVTTWEEAEAVLLELSEASGFRFGDITNPRQGQYVVESYWLPVLAPSDLPILCVHSTEAREMAFPL